MNYNPSHGRRKDGELWSTNKKVIGAPFLPNKIKGTVFGEGPPPKIWEGKNV